MISEHSFTLSRAFLGTPLYNKFACEGEKDYLDPRNNRTMVHAKRMVKNR